jgi:hypothetical protein
VHARLLATPDGEKAQRGDACCGSAGVTVDKISFRAQMTQATSAEEALKKAKMETRVSCHCSMGEAFRV